ncbi:MAG: PAS domain-containing protein, partial [Deltaproteobacteria bacterium]
MEKIKTKVILILFCVFFGYAAIDYGIQKMILLPSFLELEQEQTIKNTKRAIQAIDREIYHLDIFCHDWSAWDESYRYAASPSEDYIKNNLPESTFFSNNLNYICIVNKEREVLWSRVVDLSTKKIITIRDLPGDRFPKAHPLVSYKLDGKPLSDVSVKGIFLTRSGPMLISSRPILNNDNEGPIHGSIIMGRFFNEDVIEKIKEQTHTDFGIYPISQEFFPSKLKHIPLKIKETSPYFIQESGKTILQAYTTLTDIQRKLALLVEVNNTREISAKGMSTIRYAFFIKIGFSIIIVLVLLILQKTVFKRVDGLIDYIQTIQRTGDLSKGIEVVNKDEIGILASEFNCLLEKLYKKTVKSREFEEELKNSERKYRTIIENAPGVIFIVNVKGEITLFEGKGGAVLGVQPARMVGKSIFKLFQDQPKIIHNIKKALAGNSFTTENHIQNFIFET